MTMTGSTNAKPKFYGIDVVRGVATCMVALAHAAYRTGEPALGGHKAFGGVLDGLFVCVDFFFVLSGFLIAWVHWRDIGEPRSIGRYFKRRLSRIYPVYWIVLLLFLLGQIIQPSTSRDIDYSFKLLFTSFAIVPNDGPTLLGVAWTLYYEIIGYLVFALMLCFGRLAVYAILVWATAIVVVNIASEPTEFPANFYLNPYHLQFLIGIAGAALLRRGKLPFPRSIAVAGMLLFLATIFLRIDLMVDHSQLAMRVTLGIFASMAILGLIEAERSGLIRIPESLQRFGVASYSIYLVHTIVQAPTIKYGWPLWKAMPSEIWIFLVTTISIVVGYIFHRVVELPVTEGVKRLMFKEDEPKPIIATS